MYSSNPYIRERDHIWLRNVGVVWMRYIDSGICLRTKRPTGLRSSSKMTGSFVGKINER